MGSDVIWEFVTLNKYTKQPFHLEEKVKSSFINLIRKFRREEERYAFQTTDKPLKSFSERQLEKLVPYPHWDERVQALDNVLTDWKGTEFSENNIVFVICPPYSASQDVLAEWAKQNNWELIHDYPDVSKILVGDLSWSSNLLDHKKPIVIPQLEKLYLKQTYGLKLLRRILNLMGSVPCKALIGIDSWAWNYLKQAVNIDVHGKLVIIPQALKDQDLFNWFQRLLQEKIKYDVIVRLTNSGKCVLKNFEREEIKQEFVQDNKFLSNLAAYSQGLALVAWRYFRENLRTEPDEDFSEQKGEEEATEKTLSSKARTIWLTPWEKITTPKVPKNITKNEIFVLHALLLHNGLHATILEKILPLSTSETIQCLNSLLNDNIIVAQDQAGATIWKIDSSAYFAVKEFFKSEGYLTDEL